MQPETHLSIVHVTVLTLTPPFYVIYTMLFFTIRGHAPFEGSFQAFIHINISWIDVCWMVTGVECCKNKKHTWPLAINSLKAKES